MELCIVTQQLATREVRKKLCHFRVLSQLCQLNNKCGTLTFVHSECSFKMCLYVFTGLQQALHPINLPQYLITRLKYQLSLIDNASTMEFSHLEDPFFSIPGRGSHRKNRVVNINQGRISGILPFILFADSIDFLVCFSDLLFQCVHFLGVLDDSLPCVRPTAQSIHLQPFLQTVGMQEVTLYIFVKVTKNFPYPRGLHFIQGIHHLLDSVLHA